MALRPIALLLDDARVLTIVAALLSGPAGAAAGAFCDPGLPTLAGDPLAYRERGDRCEGRYAKEVASSVLTIASLSEPLGALGARPERSLRIGWGTTPRGASDARVRAQSLKRRIYYRMDTRRPADSARYDWPLSVAAALVPAQDDVGITVSVRLAFGGGEHDVLLPAVIGDRTQTGADRYEMVVIPGGPLQELMFSLLSLDAEGSVSQLIRGEQPLGYGYYPADRAIVIPIARTLLKAPGLYRLDLVARLENGGRSSRSVWFFDAGAR